AFGYLPKILPPSSFFANLESKPPLSNLVNVRGFIKAEDGRRGGWWLPLWNDDSVEDTLESPINSTNNADEQNQTGTMYVKKNMNLSRFYSSLKLLVLLNLLAPSINIRQVARSSSPDPHSTPVFVVPSSNTTRSNSPAPENVPLTAVPTTGDPNSNEKD
ncbi:7453_t:CDS:1, partial [Racocetra fulgida]